MSEHNQAREPLVTGTIVLSARVPAFSGAGVHVTLEDVSRADAGATIVARAVIPAVSHDPSGGGAESTRGRGDPAGTRVPFAVPRTRDTPAIDPRAHYAVRVWVDRDGDGKEAPGDLYSDQSYPVLTHGFGNQVTIMLGPG